MSEVSRYGRVFGERHPVAKLSDEDVGRIRALNARGVSYADLAEAFGLSVSAVGKICRFERRYVITAMWSEHNTEAFAGLHNKGKRIVLVFDEASAIADKVWEVAEGALTDEETEIIWVAFGNPTRNTGRFRECFRRYKHRWHHAQIDSRTVEGTNKAQIAKWAEDYGEESDFFKVRVRGMFPSMSARQFISETDVAAAYGRHVPESAYAFAPKIITVDPAWEGDDEFVIGLRRLKKSSTVGREGHWMMRCRVIYFSGAHQSI